MPNRNWGAFGAAARKRLRNKRDLARIILASAVALAVLFIVISALIPLYGFECEYNQNARADKCTPDYLPYALAWGLFHVVDKWSGAMTALATVFLAWITWELAGVTGNQAKTTKDMHEARRAYVFAVGIFSEWVPVSTGDRKRPVEYHWRVRPTWKNTGETPTRNLRVYTDWDFAIPPAFPNFNFDRVTLAPGVGLIPPDTTMQGGPVPRHPQALSPSEIKEIQLGKRSLFVWGWAKYNDIFEGTPEHVTKFCFQILIVGDPIQYKPGTMPPNPGSLAFTYVMHSAGNCADDECKF
jgi:hypothetical protein